MGRQLVLSAAFSLVLLVVAFTPGCQGRPHTQAERMFDTEDNAEVEDENVNEGELNEGAQVELLARLLTDHLDKIAKRNGQVIK